MLLFLQITFTILSAICIAGFMPLGAWLGWGWAIGCALLAGLFFMLMLLCKQSLQMKQCPTVDETENEEANKTEMTPQTSKTTIAHKPEEKK